MRAGTRATERALRASIQRDKEAFDTLIREGMRRLHAAAASGHVPGIVSMLEKGADVATQDSDGSSALHVAVAMNKVEAIKLLLGAGAPVDAQNAEGDTALHFACSRQSSLRIRHRRYAMKRDPPGPTPEVEEEVVRTLLEAGADECALNSAGWSPLDQAKATPKPYMGTSLIRKRTPLGPYRRPMPGVIGWS